MKRTFVLTLIFIFVFMTLVSAQSNSNQSEEEAVVKVLDDFHDAASNADGVRYFNHFTEDAIFIGTDAKERWTVKEFKEYAKPSFSKGRGWTYTAETRHIYISKDQNTAWFDESLSNANFGECRGSGVLVKQKGVWKIAQYNLTIPIPNSVARSVVKMIREKKQ
jgi:ketosteroid isomerase-like protein